MNYSEQISGIEAAGVQLFLVFRLLPPDSGRLRQMNTIISVLFIMFWVHLGPVLAPYRPTIICPPAAVKRTKL